MPFTTLIDSATLAEHLSDSTFVIVDCRYSLDDEAWGRREYEGSHIPGAVYAHLGHDLAGEKNGRNGRHPLPSPEAAARTFGRLGIDDGVQVVAYDQDAGFYASRLWWMLRWLGHDAVAVLDGGFAKWLAEKRPTRSGEETRPAKTFAAAPRPDMAVAIDDIAKRAGSGRWRLVDARAPERYRGETETIDRVAGHIPGAANFFFKRNLTEAGTFHAPDALRRQFRDALGATPPEQIVCYCGSGVTACHNLLALEHAGLHGAKLYAGSWSEWSSDPKRPVERG